MASLGGESVIAPYSSMILCPTLASMGLWCTLSVTPPPKKVPKYWRSIRCHPDSSDNHNYTPGRKREGESPWDLLWETPRDPVTNEDRHIPGQGAWLRLQIVVQYSLCLRETTLLSGQKQGASLQETLELWLWATPVNSCFFPCVMPQWLNSNDKRISVPGTFSTLWKSLCPHTGEPGKVWSLTTPQSNAQSVSDGSCCVKSPVPSAFGWDDSAFVFQACPTHPYSLEFQSLTMVAGRRTYPTGCFTFPGSPCLPPTGLPFLFSDPLCSGPLSYETTLGQVSTWKCHWNNTNRSHAGNKI